MHGGRELIYEPPTHEEEKHAHGSRVKGTVTEFKRPMQAPVVQGDEKKDTVIPFRVRNDKKDEFEQSEGRKPATRKQTPRTIDQRD